MSSIRLHREYGLNPTIPVCFWCGEDTGEIALLGSGYKGEAPHKMILNYQPCPKCMEMFAQGVLFVEVVPSSKSKYPPLGKDGALSTMSPTGRHVVVKMEAVDRMGISEPMLSEIKKQKRAVLEPATFDALFAGVAEKRSDD